MSLRNIGIVYRKELTEALRDRRTLISSILIPLFLFPVLTVGIGYTVAEIVGEVSREPSQNHDSRRRGLAGRGGRTEGPPRTSASFHVSRLRRPDFRQENSRCRRNSSGFSGRRRRAASIPT